MSEQPLKQDADKWVTWVQLPRRIVLLLLAFALVRLLLYALRGPLLDLAPQSMPDVDWSFSWVSKGQLVSELIQERRGNTLILLGAALVVILILTLIKTLIAVLVHKLEEKVGPVGSILKGLGRLWVFGGATLPVYCIGIILIQVFTVSIRLLPVGGMYTLGDSGGGLSDRLKHLILPTLTLSLLPTAITAQALAWKVASFRERGSLRFWLSALFTGLGVLFGQIGGLFTVIVVIEPLFAWPGIARLGIDALFRRDFPVVLGVLASYTSLILLGRLLSELFRWLARLTYSASISPQPEPTRWRKTARIIWAVIGILCLFMPLGFAAAGLLTDPDNAVRQDVAAILDPPSSEHIFGTDRLGRDIAARIGRGALIMLGMVALIAVLLVLPSGVWGALTGFLRSTKSWWGESLADLLLLPLDALLLLPSVFAASVIVVLFTTLAGARMSWLTIALACTIVLLPRAVRAFQTLWTTAPERNKWLVLVLAGAGALLTGTMFAGMWLISALDFLGLGVSPPTPTLSNTASDTVMMLRQNPIGTLAPILVLGACSFAFYIAADALTGFFNTKEVMARFNE